MAKKVDIKPKPDKENSTSQNPDNWVNNASEQETKRYSIDLPKSLHTRIKIECAKRGSTMRDEILIALEKHFSAEV